MVISSPSRRASRLGFSVSVGVISALSGASAMAQGAADAPAAERGALQEVTVTARKVNESLQNVPIAITALSGEQLEKSGVRRITDLQMQAPNLAFRANNESTGVFVVMRGQVQASGELNTDSPVGIYFDGVNMPRARGLGQAMFDVERVEILKGPQGTLYGRNTTGGTLNVISKKPSLTDGFGGNVEGAAGNYQYYDYSGALNIPVSDTLALRVAGQRIKRDGFSKNEVANRPDRDLDDQNQKAMRISALWEPSDAASFHLVADWKSVDESARATTHTGVVTNPNSALFLAVGVEAGLINLADPATVAPGRIAAMQLYNSYSSNNYYLDHGQINDPLGILPDRGTVYEDWGLGMTATFDFGAFNLTSLTGYRTYKITNTNDLDDSPFTFTEQSESDNDDFVSEELRLDGTLFSDRMRWLAGAYYSDEEGDRLTNTIALLAINPANPSITQGDFQNTSWALFSQLGFDLTEALKLTAGTRYTEEKKDFVGHNRAGDLRTADPNDGTCRVPPAGQPFSNCNASFSDTFGKWSWLMSLDYHFTPSVMGYVSAASSWRGGGQNSRGSISTLSFATFQPETATNYEVGLKADWLGRTLRSNLAVFYTDYQDVQRRRTISDGGVAAVVLTNAAKAHIPGIELDLEFQPIDALTLRGSLGYVDPKYDTFNDLTAAGQVVDRSNEAFENVAKLTYTLDARFEQRVGPGVGGFGMNWAWQDEIDNYLVVTDPTIRHQDAIIKPYGLLNARLDYTLEESGWSFVLWGTNILDKEYLSRIQDVSTSLGTLIAFPGTRRLWAFQVQKKF